MSRSMSAPLDSRAPQDWREPLMWFAAAALAAPLGIVLHEAAHFAGAQAFGFEQPTLHFASAGYAYSDAFWQALHAGAREQAALIYPVTHAGLVALAGVGATWILALGACWAAPRVGLRSLGGALLAAFALTAAIRWVPGVIYLVAVRPRFADARPNLDEFRASAALGIPVDVLVLGGVAVTVLCLAYLVPRMPPRRWLKLAAVAAGFALGVAVWMSAGRYVLP